MSDLPTSLRPTIGLEIHVQLAQKRKMFSPEAVTYGEPPNTYTSPTTLAHPGTLPYPNHGAILAALKMGLACGSEITRYNLFARKNYYYADLPKGFQITQAETALCQGGYITLSTQDEKKIPLERIHLEEDTGKSIHPPQGRASLLDYNRAGTPLIEIVTRPALTTPQEIERCLLAIRRLVRYLGISNGNMEEGSLRCDVNVSLNMGTKVEVKNLNSRRHASLAARYEIERQRKLLERGEKVTSATRSYDPIKNQTILQRKKEGKTDYRYFIEPNLSPFLIDEKMLSSIREDLPTLPHVLYEKLTTTYGLPESDALILTEEKALGLFFEEACRHTSQYKIVANLMIGPLKSHLNQEKIALADLPLTPQRVAQLAELIAEDTISFSVASMQLFPLLLAHPDHLPATLAKEKGLLQVSNLGEIKGWIQEVLENHPQEVSAYQNGKKGLFGFLMGQVMKRSQQKANPKEAATLLQEALDALTPIL